MPELHLITTAAELAALASRLAPDTPVLVGFSEREAGADPHSPDGWVVGAEYGYVSAGDAEMGLIADGPVRVPEAGHRADCPDPDDMLHACLLPEVLVLRARQQAPAGRPGGEVAPVLGEVRRRVAAHAPEGDVRPYLSELAAQLEAVHAEVRQEAVRGLAPGMVTSPLAYRLRRIAAALETACRESRQAVAFGRQCVLAADVLDDQQACDQERLDAVVVYLPHTPGYGEGVPGCPVHVAVALAVIAGACLSAPTAR
ncbi:hypothetical protein GCM10010156_73000 [Planobispora rosea]|uniref:Uncharacterized protein n=1 Tax=Planobispora rosea TaxID=35762 RepID=A0A8J3SFS3_PLARO|nr:hypothetical protein [Planobispora rosea]GGT04589.1 hypothetical protein GCM10010156_73000 [Planobispora rosea]GIH88888.1 hypothetical protein Pro02_72960 [Planobispora rosea]